jgi:hypothetical protein
LAALNKVRVQPLLTLTPEAKQAKQLSEFNELEESPMKICIKHGTKQVQMLQLGLDFGNWTGTKT